MKTILKSCIIMGALTMAHGAIAVTVSGVFSGKGLLTDFSKDGAPKTKIEVSMELDDASAGIIIVNGNQIPDGTTSYGPPYLYVKFLDSEGSYSGRLKIKGPPGNEKSLSGTLHRTVNGFIGYQELKVNLKRLPDMN